MPRPSEPSRSARDARRRGRQASGPRETSATGRLGVLYAVTEAALRHLRLDELLPELLDHVRAALAADAVAILLASEDGEELVVRATRGIEATAGVTSVPKGRGVAGTVLATGRPWIVEDLAKVEVANPTLRAQGLRSLLAVPLVVEGTPIGVAHVGSRTPRAFTAGELELFELIADRIAYAIEQARRIDALRAFAEQQRQLAAFSERAVPQEDFARVLADAAEVVARTLDVDLVDVLELRDDGSLVARALVGFGHELLGTVVLSRGDGSPPARALEGDTPVVVRRAREEAAAPSFLAGHGVESSLAVPIRGPARPFGTVCAHSRRRRTFNHDEARFVASLAAMLALVVERRRADARLREERQRLATVLEILPVGVLIVDRGGTSTQTNAVVRGLFDGIPERARPSDPHVRAYRPDGSRVEAEERPLVRALRSGESVKPELYRLDPPGPRRDVLVSAVPIRADDGAIAGAAGVFVDVTETMRAEREQRLLADASAMLASSTCYAETLPSVAVAALSLLGDACVVHVIEPDGRAREVATVGRARSREAGEGRAPTARLVDVVIRTRRPLVHPPIDEAPTGDVASTADAWTRACGVSACLAVPLLAHDRVLGAIAFSSARARAYDASDLSLARDLARRVALAIENAHLREEADEAARMRADFVAIASHDLRNPLSAIATTAHLLARTKGADEASARARTMGATIERNSARMNALIGDLLDLERIRAGGLELHLDDHEAGRMANDVVEMLAPVATARKQRLVAVDAAGDARLRCDRDRVMQVLSNLVGNAIKHAGESARIEVRAEAREGGVRFAVSDDGPGIAPADLPHVTERAWRGRNAAAHGVGLGLAIAKGIVEAHGARLDVTSEPGRGTCFEFVLPYRAEHSGPFKLARPSDP